MSLLRAKFYITVTSLCERLLIIKSQLKCLVSTLWHNESKRLRRWNFDRFLFRVCLLFILLLVMPASQSQEIEKELNYFFNSNKSFKDLHVRSSSPSIRESLLQCDQKKIAKCL